MDAVQLDKVYNGDCETMMNAFKNLKVCIVTDPPYNVGYHYQGYDDSLDEYDYLSLLRFVIGKTDHFYTAHSVRFGQGKV